MRYVVLANVPLFHRIGGVILSRWAHFLAGITWIGILYYFNFVQVPSFAAFEAGSRTEATAKLVPRALWWFRWGAMLTLLSGISILAFQDQFDGDYFKTPQGISIATGILLALIMFANVWFVIWPVQKRVIANAEGVLAGRDADPAAAGFARRGLLASRTNTLFSIPMLFFMAATSHFAPVHTENSSGRRAVFMVIVVVLAAILEANALGALVGTGPGPTKRYLETHRDTIIAGFALAVILIALFEICFG